MLATATGGLACLLVPGLFDDILLSPYLRAGLVGIALFAVPARLLAIPTGIGRGRPLAERVSIDFVCSSALLLPALALPVFLGTGLGLSTSFNILENHGARALVASEVGEGTRFTIVLPIDHAGGAPTS